MLFKNILKIQKWPKKCFIYKFRGKCVRYWQKKSFLPLIDWPNEATFKKIDFHKKMPFDVSITMQKKSNILK